MAKSRDVVLPEFYFGIEESIGHLYKEYYGFKNLPKGPTADFWNIPIADFLDEKKEIKITKAFDENVVTNSGKFRVYLALQAYATEKKIPVGWFQKFPYSSETDLENIASEKTISKERKHSRPESEWTSLNRYALPNYMLKLNVNDDYRSIRIKVLKLITKYLAPPLLFDYWGKKPNWKEAKELKETIRKLDDVEDSLYQMQNLLNCTRDILDRKHLRDPSNPKYNTSEGFYQVLLTSSILIKDYLEYKKGWASKLVMEHMVKC